VLVLAALAALPATAADIATITHGDAVDLRSHLVQGKLVLFDFYADWCGPCRALEPHVRALADANPDRLVVRKVDIVNWGTPVQRQYDIRFVPHLKLYGADGSLLREGDAGDVLRAAQQALGGGVVTGPRAVGGGGRTGGGRSVVVPLLVLLGVAGVVAFLLLGRGRGTVVPVPSRQAAVVGWPAPSPPADAGGDPRAARVWFVWLQGSLQGPFSPDDLEGMVRRGVLGHDARARRKGDAQWRDVGELAGDR
jgi:thiol-disulfide isomerase/thioredoxin